MVVSITITIADVVVKTVLGLKRLVEAIEDRFNGRIFPIDFDSAKSLYDEHVALVASIFTGAEIPKNSSKFERVYGWML